MLFCCIFVLEYFRRFLLAQKSGHADRKRPLEKNVLAIYSFIELERVGIVVVAKSSLQLRFRMTIFYVQGLLNKVFITNLLTCLRVLR